MAQSEHVRAVSADSRRHLWIAVCSGQLSIRKRRTGSANESPWARSVAGLGDRSGPGDCTAMLPRKRGPKPSEADNIIGSSDCKVRFAQAGSELRST